MASLTSAGLWYETASPTGTEVTLTLKIGVWTKINAPRNNIIINFTGTVFVPTWTYEGGPYPTQISITANRWSYVMRVM